MDTRRKFIIPADAAKYDASCASSGPSRQDSSDGRGLGSTAGAGLCHSCAPDGRCISLPKVLLANIHDCEYGVDRAPKERQLRVPGRGVRSVERLLMARRARSVPRADLERLRMPAAKVLPFMALPGPLARDGDASPLRPQMRRTGEPARAIARERQADLFA